MNTWEIIKEVVTANTGPETMGRYIKVNQGAALFILLLNNISDRDEALECFNNDQEVREALQLTPELKALKDAGIIG